MRKTILSMLMIASCFGVANAQLVVDRLGKTAIGYELQNTNDTLYSDFTINGRGNSSYTSQIKSDKKGGLRIQREQTSESSGDQHGIYVLSSSTCGSYNYGIYSKATGDSNSELRRNIGVLGTTGLDDIAPCVGIMGITGTDIVDGIGVYGGSFGVSRAVLGLNNIGRYAGYFSGDARVTGTLTAGTVVTSSDFRLKENIRSLSSSDGCLGKLMSMNVVEFNNKQREYEIGAADLETEEGQLMRKELEDGKAYWYEEESPIIKNKHYGLIAQELKEIYPDLVVESQDGFLAVNYLEIIPLLIRSVQELKAELDASNSGVKKSATRSVEDAESTAIDAVVTALYQNEPNPFTESTLIRCDVAEDVAKADLYIYTMNGEQLAEYAVTERGETSVTIDGGSLSAGMYLYALIADGKVVDTKRMILTK